MTPLFQGDNLTILREKIADERVDLVYLDPPFNSRRDYAFRERASKPDINLDAAMTNSSRVAFEDCWRWDETSDQALADLRENQADGVAAWLEFLKSQSLRNLQTERTPTTNSSASHDIQGMAAYLAMMAVRIVELRRVLKPTGSLYLHCDPSASHYLKMLLDLIFGPENFRNEIIWHYSGWNARLKNAFNTRHDVILFYAKDEKLQLFNGFAQAWASEEEYVRIRKQKIRQDEHGKTYVLSDAGNGRRVKRYLAEAMRYGQPVDDVWDIPKLNHSAKESLGYPTQKPLALLERIIEASSLPNEVVLDPFCGSGTTLCAAQKLERAWMGIDQSSTAIAIAGQRLNTSIPESAFPVDLLTENPSC